MTPEQERRLIQRLAARMRGKGLPPLDPEEWDLAPRWARITGMAAALGVEHPYMVYLYPEDLPRLLKNDYNIYAEVVDI